MNEALLPFDEWVWKANMCPKFKFFLWLCAHNSIMVKDVLANCGIDLSPFCPKCGADHESITHLLHKC